IKPIGLDIPYTAVLLIVIGIAVFSGRRLLFAKGNSGSDWQLFFLGSAFILLELQSISRLSLIFGNTWLTSSIVVNGVLLMILAANLSIMKFGKPAKQGVLYVALVASLMLSYFLPVGKIFTMNPSGSLVNNALITVVTLLPMFVAGLVFATAYSKVKNPGRSFAFNLLGSVAGGLLEYQTIFTGINSLILMALGLYCASYFAYRKDTAKPEESAALVENSEVQASTDTQS
ncbi:MAG: hypothetical protein K2X81_08500, partial [Candidatus Obscuribacterales bacterium]|nr:hypothetical protein [Candidatus Obscuribacterales bacterium]